MDLLVKIICLIIKAKKICIDVDQMINNKQSPNASD